MLLLKINVGRNRPGIPSDASGLIRITTFLFYVSCFIGTSIGSKNEFIPRATLKFKALIVVEKPIQEEVVTSAHRHNKTRFTRRATKRVEESLMSLAIRRLATRLLASLGMYCC
jgi:hypothetical protein